MKIDFQGFGYFDIDKDKYPKLIETLDLEDDLFLDILDMSKICIPILCINFKNIESEGPQPFGHNKTDIGINRFDKLIKEGIISNDRKN